MRGAELVGMKYVDGELVENPNAEWVITDTTRRQLRDLEARALEEGWSPDEFATRIEELIDDADRAERIAETELSMAQQAGSMEEWRESGVVAGKIWLLSQDHPEPDECDDNADAGEIPVDEDFPSGDDTAPAHVSCFCDCAPVVEGEAA